MTEPAHLSPSTVSRDGRDGLVGRDDELAWINSGLRPGLSITAAVPSVFEAYATLSFPLEPGPGDPDHGDLEVGPRLTHFAENRFDKALVRVLGAHSGDQAWWLGFLDTGATDVVFPDAPRAHAYANASWRYVLVQAGPEQALRWRRDDGRWHTALPEIIFPVDRSWLLYSLWDDAWACIGGPASLINTLLLEPALNPERTDPSVPDMWPSHLPEWMHERLKR